MLVTSNQTLSARAERLRNYGQNARYHHTELGMNSRLDEIHAAILGERLKCLPEFTARRQRIALAYRTGINSSLIRQLASPEEPGSHVYHLYVINCNQRDLLQANLHNKQIQTLIHYPICIHQQDPLVSIKRDPEGLSNSEYHAATCLSLPCHPQMSDEDVSKVIDAVNLFKGA